MSTTLSIFILCFMLSVVRANPAGYYKTVPLPAPAPIKYEERDYQFAYAVKDDASYNQQSREESKNGNTVTGRYTVLEPDGGIRVVNYIADDNGFRAEVQKQQTSSTTSHKMKTPYYAKSPYAH